MASASERMADRRILPAAFFKLIFGNAEGYVCLSTMRNKGDWKDHYFQYPAQLKEMHTFVESNKYIVNLYFCPQLLDSPKRAKENVNLTTCAWADLDECRPSSLLVKPTIALESSPGRYQAFWVWETPQVPTASEDVARRIAYHHSAEGADKSGWDLTQMLRVPGTHNFKYGDGAQAPEVVIVDLNDVRYRLSDFDVYPTAPGHEALSMEMPEYVAEEPMVIMARYPKYVGKLISQFNEKPDNDRSGSLFALTNSCLEAGMSPAETFQVAKGATCNKWPEHPERLWADIVRAVNNQNTKRESETFARRAAEHSPLATDEEITDVNKNPTFLERYIEWATSLGDAAPQYHQAGALVLLSSLLANCITLPTSFGMIIPNLWFMLLADSTITRKSTSMNIAADLIEQIDPDLIMTNDGSIEGLSTALSERPGRVSIFLRDEFTGLMESMSKKDYMAGMPEFFTQLYDCRTTSRQLRKEKIKIVNPRLIIYAGGIKKRMQQLVTYEQVTSGFIPRFVFITAMADISKVKDLGPPTEQNLEARRAILDELTEIRDFYNVQVPVMMQGKAVGVERRVFEAKLTADCWRRYNMVNTSVMNDAMKSGEMQDILMPTYIRLVGSILKTAILIAASRSRMDSLVVEEEDLIRALVYGESWRQYAYDVITKLGQGPMEHKIELVLRAIQRYPGEKASRSILMQNYHLTAQEMNQIVRTLEERDEILVTDRGPSQTLAFKGHRDYK